MKKSFLTEEQIKYYSKRIVNYLTDVRKRGHFSQEYIASVLNISLTHYKRMEAESYQEDARFMNSIELLAALASLDNFDDIHSFVYYLDNPNKLSPDNLKLFDGKVERKAYTWENKLISAFNGLDIDTRSEFCNEIIEQKEDPNKLERFLKITFILEELFFKKRKVLELKILDEILEIIFSRIRNKPKNRITSAKNVIKKIFDIHLDAI